MLTVSIKSDDDDDDDVKAPYCQLWQQASMAWECLHGPIKLHRHLVLDIQEHVPHRCWTAVIILLAVSSLGFSLLHQYFIRPNASCLHSSARPLESVLWWKNKGTLRRTDGLLKGWRGFFTSCGPNVSEQVTAAYLTQHCGLDLDTSTSPCWPQCVTPLSPHCWVLRLVLKYKVS